MEYFVTKIDVEYTTEHRKRSKKLHEIGTSITYRYRFIK